MAKLSENPSGEMVFGNPIASEIILKYCNGPALHNLKLVNKAFCTLVGDRHLGKCIADFRYKSTGEVCNYIKKMKGTGGHKNIKTQKLVGTKMFPILRKDGHEFRLKLGALRHLIAVFPNIEKLQDRKSV